MLGVILGSCSFFNTFLAFLAFKFGFPAVDYPYSTMGVALGTSLSPPYRGPIQAYRGRELTPRQKLQFDA